MAGTRYLHTPIREDALASGKMAFISGPRQVGKTTLAKGLLHHSSNYFSWDDQQFRRAWSKSPKAAVTDRGPGPVVLDELHKDRRWKQRLKGIYDTQGSGEGLIVTGSARLDLYRKGGDSLLGRYLPYRLHPFTVAESATPPTPDEILIQREPARPLSDLMHLGGFPEPLFGGSEAKAKRWSRLRLERLLREDVRDLRAVDDLSGLTVLADLLPERVASLLSVNSMREDVGVAYATVRSWLQVFEALYHSFTIFPYYKRIARAIRATPKLYLFDILDLPANATAQRLENITALHLLKACHYWTDLALGEFALHYVRDKQGREVDFVIVRDKKPWLLVECKSNDMSPSPNLAHFSRQLGEPRSIQLVQRSGYDREYPEHRLRVMDYELFLAGLV